MVTPPPEDPKENSQKKSSLETFAISQNMTIDEIKEKFPALYSDLSDEKMNLNIDEVKGNLTDSIILKEEKKDSDPFRDYDPNVYDFLARAKTKDEGYEVIEFLTKQGIISSETEKQLKGKLETSGIRSFGPKRSSNYYFKMFEEIRNRKWIQKRYPPRSDNE